MNDEITRRICVYGIVQGVGFRPTVSRHALANDVRGSVCNRGPYVEIYAQGPEKSVNKFITNIEKNPPKRAVILKINIEEIDNASHYEEFKIIESNKTKGEIFVSPDIAICDECKEELFDKNNRRYLHPFVNCTCCGPRLTILDSLPYDRECTSMNEFPMCPECAAEYHDPETRRYDAQPVCCNECGPSVYLIGREERDKEAITYARRVIADGGIAAIKGIGGFHLCCDATNENAVKRLRELKKRPMKPLAIMARNIDAVRKECEISEMQAEILDGHQKPIMLLRRRSEVDGLCESLAPDNPNVGVMLPYAPIHMLLFDYDDEIKMSDYLVMTSGNISGAPICRDDDDAVKELSHICDCMLSHDRKIRIRSDDSVMDFYRDKPYMIRRSRGYAPLPFMLSTPYKGQVLAIGGELKNSFCIGVDNRFYPSPYVGDLEDIRTVKALKETINRFETLLEVEPQIVCCDMHPKYNSTMIAHEMGLPVIEVQHHYAHILACMAENDRDKKVIGVSFDGTGYGTDGTIWGGEFLVADFDGFERSASITPFVQVGGDASSKEGWRIAISLIYSLTNDKEKSSAIIENLGLCTKQEAAVQFTMADRMINSVISTSAGRLFDAVSAILGIRKASTFEGEASMALQFMAEKYAAKNCEISKDNNKKYFRQGEERLILDTGSIIDEIIKKRLDGEAVDKLAYLFHSELAAGIESVCEEIRRHRGINDVALSGGVFQNKLLLELTQNALEEKKFNVLLHSMVPPNDGGIALGQAVYAMHHTGAKEAEVCV